MISPHSARPMPTIRLVVALTLVLAMLATM